MTENNIAILLTATIDPKDIILVKRNDPKVREKDYLVSLTNWIKKTNYKIVFCENSGYNIEKIKSSIKKQNENRVEFISFNGQLFPGELGKGYGELITIKYAIKKSNYINDSLFIIKVSGRYFINNIKKIVNQLLKNSSIYVMADLKRYFTWADSRIFAFKTNFISEYLSKFQDYLNDSKGFYFEHALARSILKAISDGYEWAPLPSKPRVVGYSGTSNVSYNNYNFIYLVSSIIHKLKNYLNKRF